MPAAQPNSGIGVAVAVVVVVVNTKAYLAHNATFSATSVTVEAVAPGTSTFAATAISGAGGSDVGVAGSIAVNVVVSNTTAIVDGTDPVTLGGANLALNASSNLDNTASATAKQSAEGNTSGIGVSVAVNVVNDTTTAGLPDGAVVNGAKDLTITANSVDAMTTTAIGGAAGGGTVVFGAQVAISISNVTTTASVGTGADLVLTGKLDAHATQKASVTTTAKGATKGGNAGIGLSLALVVANHVVESILERNVTAAGPVSFAADGSSANVTEAAASSAGAKGKSGNTAEGKDDSNKDVNEKADKNLELGNNTSSTSAGKNSGSSSTPAAKSGENGGTKVTVAAAVAIAIVTSKSVAKLADGVTVTTTGPVSLKTSADTDSSAKASGKAVDAETANIGAAVAINLVKVTNEAVVGLNGLVSSHGLSLIAAMRTTGGADGKHTFVTDATAGAGKGKVAVAGALALTIADVRTNAEILSNAGRGPPGHNLNANDLTLSATSVVVSTAKAKAKDEESGTVGIGAGAAINSVDDTTTASIAAGAAFTGVKDVTLTATATNTLTTYAEAGTAGGSGSTLALTADAAIALATVTTKATIAGAASETLGASGKITLTATQTAKTTTTAKADAVQGTVVIGLALALAIVHDEVSATSTRSLTAGGGDVALSASGSSSNTTEAFASATGAKNKDDDTSGKDTNKKANDQVSNANASRTSGTGKSANTSNTDNAKATTSDSNGQGGNTVTVAGAFAINIVDTRSEAWLGNGSTVSATGKVALSTLANTDAAANADGKATEAGTVGIGVAVSVNKVDIVNEARTGNATISSNGLEVLAGMRVNGDDRIQRFDGSSWTRVEVGEEFPEQPENDDFFQLTKSVTATTTVDGDSQDLAGGTLTVKNAADFGPTGTFKVTGGTGTCKYTGKTGTSFTGITGCTGTPADKATVTSATTTKVGAAGQSLAGGTLNVAATADFKTAGKFTVGGINGTCSYTGKTPTSFTGVTGCTGTPAAAAVVTPIAKAPGIYKWNNGTSAWDLQLSDLSGIASADAFPASPATGAFFRLAEHDVSAEAKSGAGSDKVSIAGALALNIVSSHTRALVGAGASVAAGTGNVSIRAKSNEEETADAASDAKGGTVGIGASVALNILDDRITRAEVVNAATFSGGANLTIAADSFHRVFTVDKAGSAGGVAVSPSVSIAIVKDETTARLGTGSATTVSGSATIAATSLLVSTLKSDGEAGGGDVAVGAAVGVNYIRPTTTAELARNLTATAVTVSATAAAASLVEANASAKGESDSGKDADSQSNDQVKNNPNSNGKTDGDLPKSKDSTDDASSTSSGESGQGSSGVGVAAAVAVNVVIVRTTATITGAITITGTTGAAVVRATNTTDAIAKAIGLAAQGGSVQIAAAVGFNWIDVENKATVGAGATVNAKGITVEAVKDAADASDLNSFQVWAFAGAGGTGSDANVAGSVGVNVIKFTTEASIGNGATLISNPGGITVRATNKIGLQTLPLAGAGGSGVGVGAAVGVNVLDPISTRAVVGANATLKATLAILVQADAELRPLDVFASDLPLIGNFTVTSIVLGGAASDGDAAIGGSVLVDVFVITTEAAIGDGAQINQGLAGGAAQDVSVVATDVTEVVNGAGGVGVTTGSAGIGAGVAVSVITKNVRAWIGVGSDVDAGGDVLVQATSTEEYLAIAMAAGVSADGAGIAASIIVAVLTTGVRAYIESSASSPTTVTAGGNVTASASDTADDISLAAGGLAFGNSAGVGISAAILVKATTVKAYVGIADDPNTLPDEETLGETQAVNATIGAAGSAGLTVSATQTEDILLIAIGGGGGGTAGVAGSAAVDVVTQTTKGYVGNRTTVTGGGVAVAANDPTSIFSLAGSLGVGGTAGVGAGVDVEVVTKTTEAWIGKAVEITVGGNVTVDATSSEDATSISAGGSFGGTAAVSVNAGVSVYDITTRAYIANGTSLSDGAAILADGSVRVAADETLKLDVVAGAIAAGGSAGVGAAVAVPVVTKNTHSWIGDYAIVNAKGDSALTIQDGSYSVQTIDTRFTAPGAISGNTINLGYDHGLQTGDAVLYDKGQGGSAITNLVDGNTYYVIRIDSTHVQLSATKNGPPIAISGGSGQNHRLVPLNKAGVQKDDSRRFDPATARSGNTITLPYSLGLATGDPVVYSSGGGSAIGGLVDGQTYYVIALGGDAYRLADTKCHATGSVDDCGVAQAAEPIILTSNGSGRSHSLVKHGETPSGDASAYGPRVISAQTLAGFRGVAVTATNSDDIAVVGVGAGFSGTAAVSLAGAVGVTTVNTSATIGANTQVNCGATCNDNVAGANPSQSVRVAAANQYYELGIAASLAIAGSAGIAVPVGVHILDVTTDAFIGSGAQINAANDVLVTADGENTLVSVVVGAGGGTVGVAGSVGVAVLEVTTRARTGSATISAGGDVLVAANDDTKLLLIHIGVAGGFVGVGATVGVATLTKTVEASIGNSSVVNGLGNGTGLSGIKTGDYAGSGFGAFSAGTFHGVAVQASSSENVFGLAAAIGGGFVGVAGAVGVTLIGITVKALVGTGVTINNKAGANALQSVDIAAVDRAKTLTIAGGAAGGFVGVGGGVDIGVLDVTVQSSVGTSSTVKANLDAIVAALSIKDVQTYAVSFGAGFVGVAGSVSVWSVGMQTTTTYQESPAGDNKGPWVSGTEYNAGDIVTHAGKQWTAREDIRGADKTTAPDAGGSKWIVNQKTATSSDKGSAVGDADAIASGNDTSCNAAEDPGCDSAPGYKNALSGTTSGGGNSSDQAITSRLNSGIGQANTKIAAGAPTNPGATATGGGRPLPLGTSSTVSGTIDVLGKIKIVARENLDIEALGGTIAGGLVGVGVSVVVLNVDTSANAGVTGTGSLRAGSDLADSIVVEATTTNGSGGAATTRATAFGVGIGLVGASGQIVVLNANATTHAHIDENAKIFRAGGGVEVKAIENRDVDTLAIAGAIGAGAIGAAISVVNAGGETKAIIGNVAVGTDAGVGSGLVRGITTTATSTLSPQATAYSLGAGLIAVSGAVALTSLTGTTRAASGAHGPLGAGGLTITGTGNHGDVTAETINVQVSLASGGLTIATASDARHTEAAMTSTGNHGTSGDVLVKADATNVATATAPGLSIGIVAITAMLPTARVSGHTTAELNGTITSSATLTVHALAENRANTEAKILNVSLGGLSGAYADSEVTSGANVEAKVGAGASVASTGAVEVKADLKGASLRNEAIAIANGLTAPGFVAAGVFAARAVVGGAVRAQLDGNVTSSASVLVKAVGKNHVEAKTLSIAVGVASFGVSLQRAEILSTADVEALSADGNNNQQITSSGKVEFTAQSGNSALAHTDVGAGGAVSGLGVTVPTSKVGGGTTASVEGNVSAGTGGVLVQATSANSATTEVLMVTIGGLGGAAINVSHAEIASSAVTDAVVLANASVSAPGQAVQVLATSANSATATTTAIGGGIGLGVNVQISEATVAGRTRPSSTARSRSRAPARGA